jgi:hypothetical protein
MFVYSRVPGTEAEKKLKMVTHEPNHSEKVLLNHVCNRFNLLTINNNWFENLPLPGTKKAKPATIAGFAFFCIFLFLL